MFEFEKVKRSNPIDQKENICIEFELMEYDYTTVIFVHLFFDTIKKKINENQHPKRERMSFKMLYSLKLIYA